MSDLISKEKLLESLIHCKELGKRSLEAVLKTIKEQPTVEPVRGEWIKSMIEQMEALNAGYMKIGFGEYSVIIADKETTEFIEAAMDEEE